MITKCCFCEYQKATPADMDLFKKAALAAAEGITEDMMLYLKQLSDRAGTHDWNSVKIHMGRKHRGQAFRGMFPDLVFEPAEQKLMDEITATYGVAIE